MSHPGEAEEEGVPVVAHMKGTITSIEGHGVNAYLYLPVLGVACENLPQQVVRSPGNLDSSPPSSLPAVAGVADNVMILDSYHDVLPQ